MGKINKEFQWRMQGILHAREVVSKDGLEALDMDRVSAGSNPVRSLKYGVLAERPIAPDC